MNNQLSANENHQYKPRCRLTFGKKSQGIIVVLSVDQFKSLAQATEFYYDELKHYATKRTGSSAVAEDIVHDTWLRASKTSVSIPENPKAYLFSIVRNLIVDHSRRDIKRVDVEDNGKTLYFPETEHRTPERSVAGKEQLTILLNTVQNLPPRRREIFMLYRGSGLRVREIADKLNVSSGFVEKQIALAMVECRKQLIDKQ